MDYKENLDLHYSESYPGEPYITRGSSLLNFEMLQPLFAPDLPTVEDLGFSSELELALWLGVEADVNKPPTQPEPRFYTLDTLPHHPPESMIARQLQQRGFPKYPFEHCVDQATIDFWNQFEDQWEHDR